MSTASAPPEINLVDYIDETVSTESKPPDFDAEIDLIERYDDMIDTQIGVLKSVDEKAAQVARLIALLLGLLLSAVSLLARVGQPVATEAPTLLLLLTVAVGAYVIALLFAIVTYLASQFDYGPSSRLGVFMSQYAVPKQEYVDTVLAGYGETVRHNKTVVVTNARRFQRCLATLLVGVVNTAGSVALLFLGPRSHLGVIVVLLSLGSSTAAAWYIVREEYLTIERELPDND